MVKHIGVGFTDSSGDGFQRHRLGSGGYQQLAGGFQGGGPAFFGREAFTCY